MFFELETPWEFLSFLTVETVFHQAIVPYECGTDNASRTRKRNCTDCSTDGHTFLKLRGFLHPTHVVFQAGHALRGYPIPPPIKTKKT